MLISVVQIGNSRGVRLPKAILEQLKISDRLEMEVEDSRIVLKPVPRAPRQGWDTAFRTMKENGEDQPLLPDEATTQGFEWEW
jgi:antitoxin MazE